MAISTSNPEYILARKRADETLHRVFFHDGHHGHSSATPHSRSVNHNNVPSTSSSDAAAGDRTRTSSSSGAINRNSRGSEDAIEDEALNDFSFVSPSLCSMSNDFFTQPEKSTVAMQASAAMNLGMSGMSMEGRRVNMNMMGVKVPPLNLPIPSSPTGSTHPQSPSLPSTTNTAAQFTESLTSHLQSIEEEYGIPTMMSINNPFQTSIRRYPMAKKASQKQSHPDVQKTVAQLTNIIFDNAPTSLSTSATTTCTIIGDTSDKKTNIESGKVKQKQTTDTIPRHLSPKEQFKRFGSTLPKKVCQHPFKRNDIVWVCRTCQADETCVLCHSCFTNSDHTNHDVAFYHAQAGGCCDCGDPDAWDPKGFCCLHGKEVDGSLDTGLEARVRGVVDYCVEFLGGFAEGVERGYNRANGLMGVNGSGGKGNGDQFEDGLRDGKRKLKSLSFGDGNSSDCGGEDGIGNRNVSLNDISMDEDDIATNYRRSMSAPAERTRSSTDLENDVNATDRSTPTATTGPSMDVSSTTSSPPHQRANMEWEIQARADDMHAIIPDSSNTGITRADECKFDATAAGTSKSRLNLSGHSPGSGRSSSDSGMDGRDGNGKISSSLEMQTPDSKRPAEQFDPEAASTSKSQTRSSKYTIPANMTPAHRLGLLGSQQQGLFLLLHADDVHPFTNVTTALRTLYYSYPNHHSERLLDSTSHKIAHLFQPQLDIGDLVVWGTQELMDELGPVLSSCWKDGDATACTRFGALMMEKAKILTGVGMVVSIKTRKELCKEIRCSAVLQFLNLMADSCDPFCRLVSVGLGAKEIGKDQNEEESRDVTMGNVAAPTSIDTKAINSAAHLVSMLQNDLKMPRKIAKSWHDLLLTLLAVPNFKAALANAYVDTYSSVTREYAHGIGIFDKSSYTLSVQFLNRPTYVEDLVNERDLLGCLVRSLFATLSVARKVHTNPIDSSLSRIGSPNRTAAWTINMIHDVIDDYLNPLGPRTTSAAWGFHRLERKEHPTASMSRLNPVLDPLHPVLNNRRYGPCVGDLKCVLNVPGVARLFSSIPKDDAKKSQLQKPCLLDAWIHTLSLLQNMDGQRWRRLEEGHVETEPRDWVGAFNAGIAIGSLYERILSWEGETILDLKRHTILPIRTNFSHKLYMPFRFQ